MWFQEWYRLVLEVKAARSAEKMHFRWVLARSARFFLDLGGYRREAPDFLKVFGVGIGAKRRNFWVFQVGTHLTKLKPTF